MVPGEYWKYQGEHFVKNMTVTGHDGGVGINTSLPRTTKNKTKQKKPNNFKTKNHQNCQEIKLHGSLTTKKLKKKHSSRLHHNTATLVALPWQITR